jgi:hypothetical protein
VRNHACVSLRHLILSACGGKDAPAAPTPVPPPAVATLNGTVSITGGARVPNATVRIFDGPK